MCCNVPIEFKLQSTDNIGFPPGWHFTFDDPQNMSLVWNTKRVLSIPGLKFIYSPPDGEERVYNSFESAFANMNHSSIDGAVNVIEKFLVHIGSSRHVAFMEHKLLHKEYCIEFSGITMFGKIMAVLGPLGHVYGEEKLLFIVQYDADALAIAKTKGIVIPSIQLLNPALAWGGCILFERKTCCRKGKHSAVQNIDQAVSAAGEHCNLLMCFWMFLHIIHWCSFFRHPLRPWLHQT